MIKEIKLKFGSDPSKEKLTIQTTPITVFVGPNNSGKSRVLTEIHQYCFTGNIDRSYVIVEDINFNGFKQEKLDKEIEKYKIPVPPAGSVSPGAILFGKGQQADQISLESISNSLLHPNSTKQTFCRVYFRHRVLKLDAINRIHIVSDQSLGDLQVPPLNDLAILFRDDTKRLEVRRIIHDAFEEYFVLDPTNAGSLRIRLSKTVPSDHTEERGLHQEAVSFHNKATLISLTSDGVKAYTGIITSIVAGEPSVTIIDEPEAFLHPSLAFKLGKEVSTTANKDLNRLFVSTHSSNFLMGCIQSGAPINIVRLTYSNDKPTARLLDNEKIAVLMKDPLLRSAGVLNALFYKYVIVTEGDSDRAFYQEINERLIEFSPSRSIPNCLFINANGKDTIWKIVKPLREMGIPAVGIYDIDILKNEGSTWTNALDAGFFPQMTNQSLGQTRSLLKAKFTELGKDMKKDGGVEALGDSEKETANHLFDQLDKYGLFVVRKGEVEHWLPSLGVRAHKSVWLPEIFAKMGADSALTDYVKPTTGDVWDFIGGIKSWMMDESRAGIPK